MLVIERAGVPAPPAWRDDETVALPCPGRAVLPDGREVRCDLMAFDRAQYQTHRDGESPGVEMLDADCVVGSLVCRPRRRGDAFGPLGVGGRQNVGDFLTNQKVPPARRQRAFCVCDGSGIVYLAPLRIDDRVKVSDGTRRVLRISVPAD